MVSGGVEATAFCRVHANIARRHSARSVLKPDAFQTHAALVTPIEGPAAENFHAPNRRVGENIAGNVQPGDEMIFMEGVCFCQAATNSAVLRFLLRFQRE
jgi:hypothetical protein